MMYRRAVQFVTLCVVMALPFTAHSVFAQMSSPSYKIPTDSINVGGNNSGAGGLILEDTIGEVGSGNSSGTLYQLSAGYQATLQTYISISAGNDVTMSPAINGVTGGTGNGSTFWTATTDNPAGYSMTAAASTNPALTSGGDSFANYTPTGANPDYTWGISSADSEFGFTPEGSSIVSRFKDNGTACDTGALDTSDTCWDSLTTSEKSVASLSTANHPNGTVTTIKFRAESGSGHLQPVGSYTATVVITVLPL